jgi:hypothetical protein
VVGAVVQGVGTRVERHPEDSAIGIRRRLQGDRNERLAQSVSVDPVRDIQRSVEAHKAGEPELPVDHVRQIVCLGVGS